MGGKPRCGAGPSALCCRARCVAVQGQESAASTPERGLQLAGLFSASSADPSRLQPQGRGGGGAGQAGRGFGAGRGADLASSPLPPDAPGQETFNATGVLLSRNGSEVSASFDGWATVSVIALSNILHASASLPPEYQNRTEGLLGEGDSDLPLRLRGASRSSDPHAGGPGSPARPPFLGLLGAEPSGHRAGAEPKGFSSLPRGSLPVLLPR